MLRIRLSCIGRMLVLTLLVCLLVDPAVGLASAPAPVGPGKVARDRSRPDLLEARGGQKASRSTADPARASDLPAASGQWTLLSIGDTEIDTFLSDTNHGWQDYMQSGYFDDVYGDTQILYRSLVQFDLRNLPRGERIDRATLRVYALPLSYQEHQPRRFHACALTEPWEEDTVTWNNQPAYGPACSPADIWDADVGWLAFDVTDLVSSWLNGSQPNYGFMLLGPEDWAGDAWPRSFRTREGAHPPELVVEGLYRIHVPLSVGFWPSSLAAPWLLPVHWGEPEDGYSLHWTASTGAEWYSLQEDDTPAFSSPDTRYTGPATSWEATNQERGIYYYRVRAGNAWHQSAWSNAVSNLR
jgi:hypothetical protein